MSVSYPSDSAVAMPHPCGPLVLPVPVPETFYTILVRDFAVAVSLMAAVAGGAAVAGEEPASRLQITVSLEMQVHHPGPAFADDIASVMSYEGVIEGLRALATTGPFATLAAVAERVAELALADPRVEESWVRVAPIEESDTAGMFRAVALRRGR